MLARVLTIIMAMLLAPLAAGAQTETVYYFHTDAVGSVRMITDANGQEVARHDYLPFGEEWAGTSYSNISNQMKYAGLERDAETGLDYARARYYRQQSGIFTQADDPAFADPIDPQSTRLYGYAYNNPLRFVDPTGHQADCIGQYNQGTNTCEPWDLGLNQFLWWSWQRAQETVATVADSVQQFVSAPRSGPCMANWIGAGAARGLAVGTALGAASGGPTVVVTAPGSVAVNVIGGAAVGSVACMSSAGGGGGGFKTPKPGVSGKEGAKNVPSWAKGQRPRVGESGKDFAKRLLDSKYGPGNYDKGPGSEFSQIQKWGDRAFQ